MIWAVNPGDRGFLSYFSILQFVCSSFQCSCGCVGNVSEKD